MSIASAIPFPDAFDPASSVLFLGSAFSVQATNILGENPPAGKGLAQKLLERLKMPENSDHDLKDLATYAQRNGIDLYALLNEHFTITA